MSRIGRILTMVPWPEHADMTDVAAFEHQLQQLGRFVASDDNVWDAIEAALLAADLPCAHRLLRTAIDLARDESAENWNRQDSTIHVGLTTDEERAVQAVLRDRHWYALACMWADIAEHRAERDWDDPDAVARAEAIGRCAEQLFRFELERARELVRARTRGHR